MPHSGRPAFLFRLAAWTLALVVSGLAPRVWAETIYRGEQPVGRADLLADLATAQVILLGETHDNPRHHQARAELLQALGSRVGRVVLEHLDMGAQLAPDRPLKDALDQVGFNAKGWHWPLHEPVFSAARSTGATLEGGNLPRATARRMVKEGVAGLGPELARSLNDLPLTEAAQARLDQHLIDGHCGQLPASRLPAMRLVQRARDAAMAQSLMRSGSGSTVLLAGNGHVRRDYGVPTLLPPSTRAISVGFLELDPAEITNPAEWRGLYDYVWLTPPAAREDPCAGLRLP